MTVEMAHVLGMALPFAYLGVILISISPLIKMRNAIYKRWDKDLTGWIILGCILLFFSPVIIGVVWIDDLLIRDEFFKSWGRSSSIIIVIFGVIVIYDIIFGR